MTSLTFIKNPTKTTQFLVTMLLILIIAEVFVLYSDFLQLWLLIQRNYTLTEAEANDATQSVAATVYSLVLIVTAIAFLRWVYLAHTNVHGFGSKGLRFTPGWAMGYYFIPILSFYKPYQAMREIWQASKKPDDWHNQTAGSFLGIWWALLLLASLTSIQALRFTLNADTIQKLKLATELCILSDVLGVAASLMTILLVMNILKLQRQLVEQNTP